MTLEDRKNVAGTVQELYFYPNCSKQECTIRICAWMISWIFGVVIPETINAQALGGCYFVLSISLLVDFLCQKRTQQLAIVIYGLLCTLLILTALGSIILIAKAPLAEGSTLTTERTALAAESVILTTEGNTLTTEETTPVAEGTTPGKLYMFVSKSLPCVGIGLFVLMFINLLCVLIEVHKFIYSEEAESKRESEQTQKAIKTEQDVTFAGFMNNLSEHSKGGEAQ